ncbi:hypothetical protein [Microbacterium sp. GCS4]|uniref:hypothetical protein n=1 Tax=Microbacterium sp. GCS4 TaxID=1692239 RepID=UPI0006826CDC|nr:hypothetical protein [Microbacterium sp. GCS4]KNY07911.1 hypothetical protein AKH00_06750 [Microbacterium sp. GCS4]
MNETNNETAPSSAAGEEVSYKSRAERRAALRAKSEKILSPAFRRWAYGVAVAAVGVAVFAGWLPAPSAAVLAPLIMALLYVDETGEPKA